MPRHTDFVWDEAKAAENLRKHGVAFRQAASAILDPLALTVFEMGHSETEERWLTLGQTSEGRLLAVSHAYREMPDGRARVRLISARQATRQERQRYEDKPA